MVPSMPRSARLKPHLVRATDRTMLGPTAMAGMTRAVAPARVQRERQGPRPPERMFHLLTVPAEGAAVPGRGRCVGSARSCCGSATVLEIRPCATHARGSAASRQARRLHTHRLKEPRELPCRPVTTTFKQEAAQGFRVSRLIQRWRRAPPHLFRGRPSRCASRVAREAGTPEILQHCHLSHVSNRVRLRLYSPSGQWRPSAIEDAQVCV